MIHRDGSRVVLIGERFNNHLDKLLCPEVHLFHLIRSSYLVCGYIGVLLAVLLATSLVTFLGLSPWVMAAIVLVAVLTFLGLVMATKIITGEEKIIYYHHEIAVLVSTSVLLRLLHEPILPYLGVTLLGIGMFLACGRIGCLMVGCCHGKPHCWGVCYGAEHAAAGFPDYFVGVRLFPIQLIESIWVFGVVIIGTVLIANGRSPGESLAWYIIAYDSGRFCFEFMRGDAARPYRWGFSEPQWTSLLLMCPIIWAELSGVLPLHLWHISAMGGMVLAMISISLSRHSRKTAKHQLLHPRHIREVAEAVDLVSSLAFQQTTPPERKPACKAIHLACTSLGIQISAGKIKDVAGQIDYFTFSSQPNTMTPETANIIAALILQLGYSSTPNQVVQGNPGIYHLLIDPDHP